MAEDITDFAGGLIRTARYTHGPGQQDCLIADEPAGGVFRDDGNPITRLNAQSNQTSGKGDNHCGQFGIAVLGFGLAVGIAERELIAVTLLVDLPQLCKIAECHSSHPF